MNIIAIVVSAIAAQVLGFLWYSPALFATPWMKYMGLNAKKLEAAKKKMGVKYFMAFVAGIIMAAALSVFLDYALAATLWDAVTVSLIAWVGFVATTMVTDVLFGNKPWGLFLINSGYQLVSLLVMSTILTMWPW